MAGTDPCLAVLDYRNTLTQGMTTSPAQRLMSRTTKTLFPTTQIPLLRRTMTWKLKRKSCDSANRHKPSATTSPQRIYPVYLKAMLLEWSHSNLVTSLGARPKSLQGLTSGHTPLRRTIEQSTAETDSTCEKRLNHQLNPSSQRQNRIWPVQMRRRLPRQRLSLTRVMPLMSHTLKWWLFQNNAGGQREAGRAQHTSRTMSVTRFVTLKPHLPLS